MLSRLSAFAVAGGPALRSIDLNPVFALPEGEGAFAADAVLANSGKEPFGLVGLEVMAAGGIAVCGATGEEYADPFGNAIVCDTSDGRELATYLKALLTDPALAARLRREGALTAARFTWPHAIEALERKIAYVQALTAG
jgi:glycosyltransferase involved in cell wall biosynthesis